MAAIRRGEVWWVAFSSAAGGEGQKTRPAVVVSNDAANGALNRVVVVPLSTQTGKIYPGEALVTVAGRANKAMADQIVAASKERLRNRLGALSSPDLKAVEQAIKLHLQLS
jgi:mRNA interferase MazF